MIRTSHWSCLIQFPAEKNKHLTASLHCFFFLCNCFYHQSKPSFGISDPPSFHWQLNKSVFLFRLNIKVPPVLSGFSLSFSLSSCFKTALSHVKSHHHSCSTQDQSPFQFSLAITPRPSSLKYFINCLHQKAMKTLLTNA